MVCAMTRAGLNMIVIDLGDGVRYQSHPEIAVKKAWSPARLRRELKKLRDAGLEPIPKLNFSTAHDAWLGPYAGIVSSKTYYQVCRDLIAEVTDLFGGPRFFHLGMDEETAVNQNYSRLLIVRQFDLWWHDLCFLFDQVRRNGVRPWIWSDYEWYHPEEFYKHMPKDVLQSNWWYYNKLNPQTTLIRCNPQYDNMTKPMKLKPVQAYLDLEAHGYDQILTGGNTSACSDNFQATVDFALRHIAPKRLYGFLMTTWRSTQPKHRKRHFDAIDQVSQAMRRYYRSKTDGPI